jgi:hypothetical protein
VRRRACCQKDCRSDEGGSGRSATALQPLRATGAVPQRHALFGCRLSSLRRRNRVMAAVGEVQQPGLRPFVMTTAAEARLARATLSASIAREHRQGRGPARQLVRLDSSRFGRLPAFRSSRELGGRRKHGAHRGMQRPRSAYAERLGCSDACQRSAANIVPWTHEAALYGDMGDRIRDFPRWGLFNRALHEVEGELASLPMVLFTPVLSAILATTLAVSLPASHVRDGVVDGPPVVVILGLAVLGAISGIVLVGLVLARWFWRRYLPQGDPRFRPGADHPHGNVFPLGLTCARQFDAQTLGTFEA